MANSILKNELEHIIWYNTLKPNEQNDIMLYHRISLINHAWSLLENGEFSDTAREDIIVALCDCFNKQVDILEKTRNKQNAEMKRMVIGSMYQVLNELDLSTAEMRMIEQSLRKMMKQQSK